MKDEKQEWEDPIVAEVRAARQAYAKELNHDPRAIFQDLLKRQERMKKEGYTFASLPDQGVPKKTGTEN